jgi:hypothetical protein
VPDLQRQNPYRSLDRADDVPQPELMKIACVPNQTGVPVASEESLMFETICWSFVGTTLLYVMATCLVCWRVMRHRRGNFTVTGAVAEYVFTQLFGNRDRGEMPKPTATMSGNGDAILHP